MRKTTANAEEREGTANAEGGKEIRLPDKKKGNGSLGWRGHIPPIATCAMGSPGVERWSELVEGFGVGVEDLVG
jgi:hypothetical protein